jgi:hypothetical protein
MKRLGLHGSACPPRRLAAVLTTDVAGHSSMVKPATSPCLKLQLAEVSNLIAMEVREQHTATHVVGCSRIHGIERQR